MQDRIQQAIQEDLVDELNHEINGFTPVVTNPPNNYMIGDIEDANVLIQNSLWLNVPLGRLSEFQQVVSLQDRRQWAPNQIEQIQLIGDKFDKLAENVENLCN